MVKNLPPASAGDVRDTGSVPESGRSPGEGNGNLLQYSPWRISWTGEPGGLQSMGSQKADWTEVTEHSHRTDKQQRCIG